MSDLKSDADYDPNEVGHALRGYGSTIAAAACISTIDLILLFVIPMLTRREELPTWVEYQVHAAPARTSRAPNAPRPYPPDACATCTRRLPRSARSSPSWPSRAPSTRASYPSSSPPRPTRSHRRDAIEMHLRCDRDAEPRNARTRRARRRAGVVRGGRSGHAGCLPHARLRRRLSILPAHPARVPAQTPSHRAHSEVRRVAAAVERAIPPAARPLWRAVRVNIQGVPPPTTTTHAQSKTSSITRRR